jgi:hypothetical protein
MGKITALHPAVEPASPDRSPERATLAAAIERIIAATAALDRVHQARAKVGQAWEVGVASAEEALKEARAREPRRLVDELLGLVGAKRQTVEEAGTALAAANSEQDRRRRIHALLDEEERAAERELEYARRVRDEAVVAVVASDPATATLLAEFIEARQRVADFQRIWLALPSRSEDSRAWCRFDELPDRGGAEQWRNAVAALAADADAELPQ